MRGLGLDASYLSCRAKSGQTVSYRSKYQCVMCPPSARLCHRSEEKPILITDRHRRSEEKGV